MPKVRLDIDGLEVVSFVTERPCESAGAAAITGTVCITRPTVYGTCCTP
jgi:hypothetical protein